LTFSFAKFARPSVRPGPEWRDDLAGSHRRASTEAAHVIDIYDSKEAEVGGAVVRRALPQRTRRTVGAWCFVDHFGPIDTAGSGGMQIGAHPHIGLHTVTWLLDGQLVHHDSLGSEQPIRAGQLNLMTAGHGIAHAEEAPATGAGRMHGAQLWVAQPTPVREGPPAFEHHAELPMVAFGTTDATVLVGELDGHRSPARADTALVGAQLVLRSGTTTVPLDPSFEHAIVVLDGSVLVDGAVIEPGRLAYLGLGRDEIGIEGAATLLLLGGEPFPERLLMWWNLVGRTWDDVGAARDAWAAADEGWFPPVRSDLPVVPAPALPPFATPSGAPR
jgi:redox-sensitive bicupin YhaK (pirin superfamily)